MISRLFRTSLNRFMTGTRIMFSRLFLTVVAASFLGSYCQAAPFQLVFPDGTYQPGSPLLFQVLLPVAVTELGAYEIQIVLTGDEPTAGVDFGFDVDATEAADAQYVFDSADLFFDTILTESATSQILWLTDLTLGAGVDVAESINDRVANVVVNTAASYRGTLTFTIDADSLILDTPDGNEIAGIAAIRTDTATAAPTTLVAIPEPSVIVATATLLCLCGSRRRVR